MNSSLVIPAHAPWQRWERRVTLPITVAATILVLSVLWAMGNGAVSLPLEAILRAFLLDNADPATCFIVWELRFPRVAMAVLVGATLALAGAAMQGLFRNPLADPGLVGVAAGAALGAVAWIVLATAAGWTVMRTGLAAHLGLAAAAFVGGALTTLLVYAIAARASRHGIITILLLAGIAINALAGAAAGLLTYWADDAQLRSITYWTMGSLTGSTLASTALVAAVLVPVAGVLWRFSRSLDALVLGEATCQHLGFELKRLRAVLVATIALAVGVAVGLNGMIGFIGLMAPHIARLIVGPSHRHLLPLAALIGGLLLIIADTLARTVAAPAEIPAGIVTALLGGPFFLYLLLRRERA